MDADIDAARQDIEHEWNSMTVQVGAARQTWPLKLETISPHGHYRLRLRSPAGVTWSAEAGDIFWCLIELRKQVEPDGVLLCCNGARRDAGVSGMLAEMGEGRRVYLLDGVGLTERPPMVETLAPAPSDDVVSVDEQLAWLEDWWKRNGGNIAPP
jgi:hypothetical protein